jgi:small subunit ribosomal protein S1
MGGSQGLQQMSAEEFGQWTLADEGYWQALLEQGECAPATAPPADYEEMFWGLGAEPGLKVLPSSRGRDGDNGPGRQDVWQRASNCLNRGELFQLKIVGANRGGLLVEWDSLQGFIPASHLCEMPSYRDPGDRVAELSRRIGDSLSLRLIEVDQEQHRLVFSERAALADFRPPVAILNALKPGEVCQGRVTNLTSFGAFVDLGGVEGLIHISEMSWDRVRHPEDVLRPGEVVETRVLGVNPEEGRIALSMKQLRPDPWAGVESRYWVDQVVDGTVTNVVSFGAFVRVEEGLEGLIHVSELVEGSFLHPRNVVHEGDAVRVRVLSIDAHNHRLALSLRQARGGGREG